MAASLTPLLGVMAPFLAEAVGVVKYMSPLEVTWVTWLYERLACGRGASYFNKLMEIAAVAGGDDSVPSDVGTIGVWWQ